MIAANGSRGDDAQHAKTMAHPPAALAGPPRSAVEEAYASDQDAEQRTRKRMIYKGFVGWQALCLGFIAIYQPQEGKHMSTSLKWATAAAAAACALFAGQAGAAQYIGTIPNKTNTNQFITKFFPAGTVVEGWYGANILLVGGPADVKIEYFGAEAGFTNKFNWGSSTLFTHAGGTGGGAGSFVASAPAGLGTEDALGTSTQLNVAPGFLPFLFDSSGATPKQVVNGANNDNTDIKPNFFVSFDNNYVLDTSDDKNTAGSGQSLFVFFDDSGASNDDNHDDMVLRISISSGYFQVPEPGSLALAGLALLGLGFAKRRRA